ncbi:MAG: SixA phosphatase family protein [Anaerolineae bacterium]
MTRTLLVMRHAKSAWSKPNEPELPDLKRPLTGQGKRDALRQGKALNREALTPDVIVTSPAKRARATAKRVARSCGYTKPIIVDERLYMQGSERYVRVAAEWGDEIVCGMLIGHNPDVSELVYTLTGKQEMLATAAIARLEVPAAHWHELDTLPSCKLLALLV